MSVIVVDMNNPTPPYEQVRREIVEQVRSGELTPGDRLPAIRVLAGDLGLAPGTVARAYKLLEEAQIIITRRGAGTTIAPGAAREARREAAAATWRSSPQCVLRSRGRRGTRGARAEGED